MRGLSTLLERSGKGQGDVEGLRDDISVLEHLIFDGSTRVLEFFGASILVSGSGAKPDLDIGDLGMERGGARVQVIEKREGAVKVIKGRIHEVKAISEEGNVCRRGMGTGEVKGKRIC